MTSNSTPLPRRHRSRLPAWLETSSVGLVLFLFFQALYSALPLDDTDRFTKSIAAGRFEWDTSHLLMQPLTVLWHKYLGFGAPALSSQKHINTVSAVVGLLVFLALLRRLHVSLHLRLTLLAVGAVSFNILSLAISGHMKLVALPFLSLSLFFAVLWETEELFDQARPPRVTYRLLLAALFLSAASLCLLSSVVVIAFFFVFLFAAIWITSASFHRAAGVATTFAVTSATPVFVVLLAFFLGSTGQPFSVTGFVDFLTRAKVESTTARSFDLVGASLRLPFGTVQNFLYTEKLGPMTRALARGEVADPGQYFALVWPELLAFLVVATLLLYTYVHGFKAALSSRPGALAAWSFLLGTLSFAYVWNLAEAEFYFPITVPTLLLLSIGYRGRRATAVAGLLVLVITVANLSLYALPRKEYRFSDYAREMEGRFEATDLVVGFAAYPGRQCLGFFLPYLGSTRVLLLDKLLQKEGNTQGEYLAGVREQIDATLDEGGRVFLFRVLDENDWNAPWPEFTRKGVGKSAVRRFFAESYQVVPIGEIAEIPCWQVLSRADSRSADDGADLH